MARINKIQRGKAIAALTKAGAPAAVAASMWRLLDLSKSLDPQIAELVEEDPDLFDLDTEADDSEDETPMTAREAQAARLKGDSEHIRRRAFRRPATERPSTAPKTAREAAAHLLENSGRNKPPTRQYIAPVRDVNTGHKPLTREPSASAKALADKLRGL